MNLDSESIKRSADIARIIGGYIELRKAGAGELVGLCPFHKESTPSFTVTPGKGLYYCFGCEANGDVFSFVKAIEGKTFTSAVERVAELSGRPITTNGHNGNGHAKPTRAETKI